MASAVCLRQGSREAFFLILPGSHSEDSAGMPGCPKMPGCRAAIEIGMKTPVA